jgi:voltage-gated potassium channel
LPGSCRRGGGGDPPALELSGGNVHHVAELIRAAFHRPETRVYRWTQGLVWTLIAVSVALLGVEVWLVGRDPGSPLLAALGVVDRAILWFFAVEITLRIASFRPPSVDFFAYSAGGRVAAHLWGRLRYCLRPLTLIDILTVAALVPALRGLRAVRLLRLLRTPRVFRYSQPFHGLARAFQENGLLFTFAFSLLGVAVLLGGTSLYLVERTANPDLRSLGDGLWWALVTITTVGFGDISPVTSVGRGVGAVMMVSGMFTLAMFAGIVGHTLLHAVLGIREEQFRMSSFIEHVVICGYDAGARLLLDVILEEIDPVRHPLVLFAEGDRPTDLPAEIGWVSGDPTKESELGKLRLSHATAAVLVGSRTDTPQQADARTVLTAFTLRSFLAKDPAARQRRRPLYVIAEILDSENVDHARTAGADEVVETTRLGFSLVAHAIGTPGTGAIMSRVAAAGAHSIWVGRLPAEETWPATFGDLSRQLKQRFSLLLLGLRDPESGEDRLNPPDDTAVDTATRLVYLAETAVLPEA